MCQPVDYSMHFMHQMCFSLISKHLVAKAHLRHNDFIVLLESLNEMTDFQQGNSFTSFLSVFVCVNYISLTRTHTCLPVGLDTHQRTKLHHQQVGSDLCALGQTLHQSMVLEGAGEMRPQQSGSER